MSVDVKWCLVIEWTTDSPSLTIHGRLGIKFLALQLRRFQDLVCLDETTTPHELNRSVTAGMRDLIRFLNSVDSYVQHWPSIAHVQIWSTALVVTTDMIINKKWHRMSLSASQQIFHTLYEHNLWFLRVSTRYIEQVTWRLHCQPRQITCWRQIYHCSWSQTLALQVHLQSLAESSANGAICSVTRKHQRRYGPSALAWQRSKCNLLECIVKPRKVIVNKARDWYSSASAAWWLTKTGRNWSRARRH